MEEHNRRGSDEAVRPGLPITIVLVGDVAVGKTSLLVSYTTNGYPTEYVPTALDEYSVFVEADQQPVRLQLIDTAGQEEEFRNLRQLCYAKADVILLCFSVVMPSSLRSCGDRWFREISDRLRIEKRPLPPLLLIGTQIDRRSDARISVQLQRAGEQPVVSEEQGQQAARKFSMQQYLECSALTQRGLKRVFDESVLAALRYKCKNHIVASIMLNNNNASADKLTPSLLFSRLSPRSGRKMMSKTTKSLPTRALNFAVMPLNAPAGDVNNSDCRLGDGGGLQKSNSNNSAMKSCSARGSSVPVESSTNSKRDSAQENHVNEAVFPSTKPIHHHNLRGDEHDGNDNVSRPRSRSRWKLLCGCV